MKIAAITDDGVTISMHFGRARYYKVLTIEDGEVVAEELRDKLGHHNFADSHADESDPRGHGFGAAAQDRHTRMAAAIADCDVLLCRGMGRGAYISMEQAGIRPIVTDIADIGEAVRAYLDGTIEDHTEYLR